MDYDEWNQLILERFFNREMAGREVLLFVNEKTLTEIGKAAGVGMDDFLKAIKEGPVGVEGEHLCKKAAALFKKWEEGSSYEAPPYLAYLAFFVLGGTLKGDFHPLAYYPRLRTLLGEKPETGPLPLFYKTDAMWDDLEHWSKYVMKERLGRFTKRVRGSRRYVGVPLSQLVLTDEERKKLPLFFYEAEIDKDDPPSFEIMKKLLREFGEKHFEARTMKLLRASADDALMQDIMNALVEIVLDELHAWDGTIAEEGAQSTSIRKKAELRLCLKPLPNLGKVAPQALLRTNFPIEGKLTFDFRGQSLRCNQGNKGWSTRLFDYSIKPPAPFDSSALDWLNGDELHDHDLGVIAKLRPSPVRVFLSGERQGVQGWLEFRRLESGCAFLVAFHNSAAHSVEEWAASSCKSFTPVRYEGMPNGWQLYRGFDAQKDDDEYPELNVPNRLSLRLIGGIKAGRGNEYFASAPPSALIEGGSGSEIVLVNGKKVEKAKLESTIWPLPIGLERDKTVEISVWSGNGDKPLDIKSIIIRAPVRAIKFNVPPRDAYGKLLTDPSRESRKEISRGIHILSKNASEIPIFTGDKSPDAILTTIPFSSMPPIATPRPDRISVRCGLCSTKYSIDVDLPKPKWCPICEKVVAESKERIRKG